MPDDKSTHHPLLCAVFYSLLCYKKVHREPDFWAIRWNNLVRAALLSCSAMSSMYEDIAAKFGLDTFSLGVLNISITSSYLLLACPAVCCNRSKASAISCPMRKCGSTMIFLSFANAKCIHGAFNVGINLTESNYVCRQHMADKNARSVCKFILKPMSVNQTWTNEFCFIPEHIAKLNSSRIVNPSRSDCCQMNRKQSRTLKTRVVNCWASHCDGNNGKASIVTIESDRVRVIDRYFSKSLLVIGSEIVSVTCVFSSSRGIAVFMRSSLSSAESESAPQLLVMALDIPRISTYATRAGPLNLAGLPLSQTTRSLVVSTHLENSFSKTLYGAS